MTPLPALPTDPVLDSLFTAVRDLAPLANTPDVGARVQTWTDIAAVQRRTGDAESAHALDTLAELISAGITLEGLGRRLTSIARAKGYLLADADPADAFDLDYFVGAVLGGGPRTIGDPVRVGGGRP